MHHSFSALYLIQRDWSHYQIPPGMETLGLEVLAVVLQLLRKTSEGSTGSHEAFFCELLFRTSTGYYGGSRLGFPPKKRFAM